MFLMTENGIEHTPFVPISADERKNLIERATVRRENSRVKNVPQPNNAALCAGCFRALLDTETTYCATCAQIEKSRADRAETNAIWRDRYLLLFFALLCGLLIFLTLTLAPRPVKPNAVPKSNVKEHTRSLTA